MAGPAGKQASERATERLPREASGRVPDLSGHNEASLESAAERASRTSRVSAADVPSGTEVDRSLALLAFVDSPVGSTRVEGRRHGARRKRGCRFRQSSAMS